MCWSVFTLQQCHEYIIFRESAVMVCTQTVTWIFLHICLFRSERFHLFISDCIMQNMGMQGVLGSLRRQLYLSLRLRAPHLLPLKLKTKEIPVSEMISEIYLKISPSFFQILIRVCCIFLGKIIIANLTQFKYGIEFQTIENS